MLDVMTVEDNNSFREMFKGLLSSEFPSAEITEAANGEEAFERLSSSAVDLVFMDIRLPGESGLELTRKIKAKYNDVTVTVLTSYGSAEYREAAARCGADGYLTKDSMKWNQMAAMVECFQGVKDSVGLKRIGVRLASECSQ